MSRWWAIVWNEDGLVYWCIYAPLGINDLIIHLFLRTVPAKWVYCKQNFICKSTIDACFRGKITLNSILFFHASHCLYLGYILVNSWLSILLPNLDYCCICFATFAISSEHENRGFFSLLKVLWSITLTSLWPQWRLKSPASRMFTQPYIQTQIKENIKAPRHWPLCGEFTGTGEFPAQRASYAENVSIWWRHHALSHFHGLVQERRNSSVPARELRLSCTSPTAFILIIQCDLVIPGYFLRISSQHNSLLKTRHSF